MFSREDLTGRQFGRLTVAGLHGREGGARVWACVCSCGVVVKVPTGQLKKGATKSCGCLHRDITSERSTTHGMSRSKEHRAWSSMIDRCERVGNRFYKNYGGRGITVCDEWRNSFQAFFDHVGQAPGKEFSIDRINVDQGYAPGNVRWATRQEQMRNRTTTKLVTVDGVTASLVEHCENRGLRYGSVLWRLKAGWPVERALSPTYIQKLKDLKRETA